MHRLFFSLVCRKKAREVIIRQYPDLGVPAVGRLAGEKWRAMSESEKEVGALGSSVERETLYLFVSFLFSPAQHLRI